MLENKPKWSRAIFVPPRHHLKSHIFIDQKQKLKPSFDKKNYKASMRDILGWEYSRIWLEERDAFHKACLVRRQVKRMSNDFSKWMDKRKPKEQEHCRAHGAHKLAPSKKKPKADAASKKVAEE